MKTFVWALVLLPAFAWADSPFEGTWVTKMDTLKISGKPDTYLVTDGMFSCDACSPGLKIKADGTDQKVTGHAYYDTASAKIVSPRVVETTTHRVGKLVGKRTLTVSDDGKTLTEDFVSYDQATTGSGRFLSTRVASGPAGSHALSGSWQAESQGNSLSSDLLTVTYHESEQGLKMSSPTGQSYDAKFDGKRVVTQGDPGKTLVSLKKIDVATIRETDVRQGKTTDVILSKVSPDGKTMHVTDEDKLHGTTMSYDMAKQ